jgi:hypothetical protein
MGQEASLDPVRWAGVERFLPISESSRDSTECLSRGEVNMTTMLQIKINLQDRKLSLQQWELMVASAIRRDDRVALRELVLYGLNMRYMEASKLTDRMVEELLDSSELSSSRNRR